MKLFEKSKNTKWWTTNLDLNQTKNQISEDSCSKPFATRELYEQ